MSTNTKRWNRERSGLLHSNRTLSSAYKHQGRVKFWKDDRQFGFLFDENGREFFVHASSLIGLDSLRQGEAVEFAVGRDKSGRPCALDVTVI